MSKDGVVRISDEMAKFLSGQIMQELTDDDMKIIKSSVAELNKCLDDGISPSIKAAEIMREWADDCILTELLDQFCSQTERSIRETCANYQMAYEDDWRKEIDDYLFRLMVGTFYSVRTYKIDLDDYCP